MFIIYMKLNENSKIVIKSLDSTHKLKKKK